MRGLLVRWARRTILALSAAGLALGVASCGGLVESDTEAAVCARGGGVWESDGCAGGGDVCSNVTCETAFGFGCHCPKIAECWDPTAEKCRPAAL